MYTRVLPPHLSSPHLASPHLTSPHLTSPHLTFPACSSLRKPLLRLYYKRWQTPFYYVGTLTLFSLLSFAYENWLWIG